MRKVLIAAGVALGLAAAPAGAQELRIGYMTTLSGGGALIGVEMKRGWDLGLEHQGWTEDGDELGGVPTRVLVGDDQREPDVGLQIVNRWLRNDRVHIVSGFIWSHVLMAVARPVISSRTLLVITNAGASPLHGEQCSRFFITTSWNNDQNAEATGQLMTDDGIQRAYLLSANYQAGKDNIAGMKRTYEGEVVGEALYPLGARDYQSELARVREANPEAVAIFAPGGMGVAFMRQWAASGLADQIRLYTVFTVDPLTMGAIGEAAVGTFHTNFYSADLENEANRRFVRAFVAAHGRPPSMFAAQAYDAPAMIASAVRAVDGNVDNTMGMMRAMRQADYPSVRGSYRYNVNGVPIQNWYRRQVVASPQGPQIRMTGIVFTERRDSYYTECPAREHVR